MCVHNLMVPVVACECVREQTQSLQCGVNPRHATPQAACLTDSIVVKVILQVHGKLRRPAAHVLFARVATGSVRVVQSAMDAVHVHAKVLHDCWEVQVNSGLLGVVSTALCGWQLVWG